MFTKKYLIKLSNDISNDSITSQKIKDGEIGTNDLANDSVTSIKIKDGEVKNADIASGAVDTDELANNAVTYAKMEIKIKSGMETSAIHGKTVYHGLGTTPTSVILTPVYNSVLGSGNAVLHANVYNVDDDSFQIALWVELENTTTHNPPQFIDKVDGSTWGPQDVYWIAIYEP